MKCQLAKDLPDGERDALDNMPPLQK